LIWALPGGLQPVKNEKTRTIKVRAAISIRRKILSHFNNRAFPVLIGPETGKPQESPL
jgi:hypothetical protein